MSDELLIGELFAGYGGLGMAVREVYGGKVAWFSEFDPAPSRILAHHHPGVPNLGDITRINWSNVQRVDILTGGFPCQDVSVAGRRAGMRDGTRSGLWAEMCHAIDQLRPPLVVIENVGGLFSAPANSIVEPCPVGLGEQAGGAEHSVLLRAADAVLGDLATLGYDAEWVALRASDVGAPHGRLRVFITAHPPGVPGSVEHGDRGAAEDAGGAGGRRRSALALAGGARGPDAPALGADPRPDPPGDASALTLLPTPVASEAKGAGRTAHREGGHLLSDAVLLPTPAAARAGRQRSASEGAAIRPTLDSIHQLLPTPRATDGTKGGPNQVGSSGDLMLPNAVQPERFGPYAPAISRWEHVLGRPSPAPTEPGRTRPRLSAVFVEWLMGLPEGHVTGESVEQWRHRLAARRHDPRPVGMRGSMARRGPHLTRNQQLKALGNGVVPQQGAAALRYLADIRTTMKETR